MFRTVGFKNVIVRIDTSFLQPRRSQAPSLKDPRLYGVCALTERLNHAILIIAVKNKTKINENLRKNGAFNAPYRPLICRSCRAPYSHTHDAFGLWLRLNNCSVHSCSLA